MSGHSNRFDNQPINFWNGNPVYLTAYLTLGLIGGLAVVLALGAVVPLATFVFSAPAFVHGLVWQPVTYIFVDPDVGLLTLLNFFCFYVWGVEVEKYLGRKRYLSLCAILIFAPVLFFLGTHLLGRDTYLYGIFLLDSGLLISFAALYPDMSYFFGLLPLKWFAAGVTAWSTLTLLSHHEWLNLGALWLDCAVAFALTRHGVDWLEFRPRVPAWLKRKPKLRVVPKPKPEPRAARPVYAGSVSAPAAEESEVDSLLDKIARPGRQSLTAAERERLEKARQAMLRKDH
jgi:hypothetical protein